MPRKLQPTFYRTIMNNKYWKLWVELNHKNHKFDVDESMECDIISDNHFNAFLDFVILENISKTLKIGDELVNEYTTINNLLEMKREDITNLYFYYMGKEADRTLFKWEKELYEEIKKILSIKN